MNMKTLSKMAALRSFRAIQFGETFRPTGTTKAAISPMPMALAASEMALRRNDVEFWNGQLPGKQPDLKI